MEKLAHELGVIRAHAVGRQLQAVGAVPAAGEVEHDLDEGLVERGDEVAEAGDATRDNGVAEGQAEGDGDVLVGVVVVDVGVAPCAQRDVEKAVRAELVQHVVEERDRGVDLGAAGAVQV